TTHETYKKIIDWQSHLLIPDDVHLSQEAEDCIRRSVLVVTNRSDQSLKGFRLICGRDSRYKVEQIKQNPFFYGVDWEAIRIIEAPFIPDLRSITDTSYFPTEDLENVPDVPSGGDTDGKNKDLAFLGCVLPWYRL